jgi:Tol biopolymer transport system component
LSGNERFELYKAPDIWSVELSPDEKWIGVVSASGFGEPLHLTVLPATGGAPKVLPLPIDRRRQTKPVRFAWTADSSGIIFPLSGPDADNLWFQKLDGSPPVQMTHFSRDQIYAVDVSRDGRRIAFSRGRLEVDAVFLRPN